MTRPHIPLAGAIDAFGMGRSVRVELVLRTDEKGQVINARVAKGSGTQPADVNRLLKQYMQMEKMMSKLSRGGGKGLLRQMSGALKGMGGMGGMLPPR